jgi:putative DNA methylase
MKKKLIEVALPLEAINKASAREKSIRHGHPSTLHLWWARRPLAAARAVIFAQMVDDPSAHPEEFPTEEAQEKERQRLFRLIEELVQWENTTNETVLAQAREEIWKSWRSTCANRREEIEKRKEEIGAAEISATMELFNPDKLPAFHDPFAGGGSLPLEAQRLGLESYASDLNPVAVLINKAMIEIPPKFAGQPPVNPGSRNEKIENRGKTDGTALQGTRGVAESDESGSRSVSPGAETSARGNLRDALSDHAGGGLYSSEHRRGLGKGVEQGEGAVSRDRSGIVGGVGHTTDPLRADRLVSRRRNEDSAEPDGRSGTDTHNNASQPPLTPTSSLPSPISSLLFPISYKGAQGLAEDVRYYGQWMRDEAEKRIGHLYPKIEITADMAKERLDLKPLVGRKLTVIAWLWARTVKSPNPAFAQVEVPLASTFMLSTKLGKEVYVEPVIENGGYRFTVKMGKPKDAQAAKNGTKLARGANFRCLMSNSPISGDYIKAEGMAGRIGARLMAIVAEGGRGRVYLSPTREHEAVALQAHPSWEPNVEIPPDRRSMFTPLYGLTHFKNIFTPRQLVALTTFSDLVQEAREQVKHDALAVGLANDGRGLDAGASGATAYADAVGVYLGFGVDKMSDRHSTLSRWDPTPTASGIINTFSRQALPMTWDYAEGNPFSEASGNFDGGIGWIAKVITGSLPGTRGGVASAADASVQSISSGKIVSTDPPYYDNVGYADLSDFFYVWLRPALKPVFSDLFATLGTPKAEELVATPYRHGSKEKAEAFFLEGMTQAMHRLTEQSHAAFPVTIYYAFKQQENRKQEVGNRNEKIENSSGAESSTSSFLPSISSFLAPTSTGWETFLDAVIRAGFALNGTWPMRTELSNRMIGSGTNALASSIVLVCRPRAANAPTATRREFLTALKRELPEALTLLQHGNIAPVDLQQSAIGPGMAVFTRYDKVLDAEGKAMRVREALALINQTLDEVLAEQEGDFDADSRWALSWFEQFGFAEGEYGVAETLSKAKNTSVGGMVDAGIAASRGGKVRLLKPDELPGNWDPTTDTRLTVWEMVHHLVRALEQGETSAAELVAKLGSKADTARELAYRLYTLCERKKRAQEALSYNALVQSWPEIVRLAGQRPEQKQEEMF